MADRTYFPNEDDAFISACKNEPYTPEEWAQRIEHLEAELREARLGLKIAQHYGACPAARFTGPLRDEMLSY
jgi:hypothetical protein